MLFLHDLELPLRDCPRIDDCDSCKDHPGDGQDDLQLRQDNGISPPPRRLTNEVRHDASSYRTNTPVDTIQDKPKEAAKSSETKERERYKVVAEQTDDEFTVGEKFMRPCGRTQALGA